MRSFSFDLMKTSEVIMDTMYTTKVSRLYLKTFLIAFLAAAAVFLPAMIGDQGYFLFVGDFNSQQVPFYMNAHDSIRRGEWAWNWYTDLGANFIGSYTFYLLGSPFFYLTLPLPGSWVPYCMGPLLMLKFACCALFAAVYLRRYVRNEYLVMLGGILYAFSGFSIYNIFFNHFHDVMVFFPLMLYAMDEWMEKGTRGLFALTVCINALVNYFFFFGEVVFVVLYYFVRLIYKGYERSWAKFFGILAEAVIGFLMSFVLMVPSALTVLQNSRVSRFLSGFNLWLYGSKERLPAILFSFLFPPELASKQVFLPDANTKWTSLSAYLPVVSVTGVIVFMKNRRHNWLSYFLRMLFLFALIPGFNALFVALNTAYYARWFYMLTLMMILATIQAIDRGYVKSFRKTTWQVLLLTSVIIAAIGLTPQMDGDTISRFGLYDNEWTEYFIVVAGTALLGLLAMTVFVMDMDKDRTKKRFAVSLIIAVLIFGVLYGNFYVFWGKSRAYDSKTYMIPDAIEGEEKITIPDKDEVIRIDVDDSLINMGMFWNISCMRAFHSVVPGSIMDFYQFLGEERSVNSKIPESQYAVRGLLGVHWYFDRLDSSTSFGDPLAGETTMPGYSFYKEMAGYNVWENDYYVPIGTTYHEYILMEDLEHINSAQRAAYMLHAAALTAEQAQRLGDVLVPHDKTKEDFQPTKSDYFRDALVHKEEVVDNLVRTKTGVTCTSDFPVSRLIYFAIPYDEGWTCLVDGKETRIELINVGFMGIVVEAGHHEIEFVYTTPGLKAGSMVSLAAILVLVLYTEIGRRMDERKKQILLEKEREAFFEAADEDSELFRTEEVPAEIEEEQVCETAVIAEEEEKV